jgi:ElaB/YqjD/DUF883 family membrane-anchored ribosome-binding protein
MANITDERTSQSELEQVKERVQDVAGEAKQQTREQLRAQIDTRTSQAGEQVSATAQAFSGASEQLRRQGNDRAASVVEAVAERSDRLGAYLTRTDGDGLLRDVEDFARRQPWLVVGAGAVAGFLTARFVKASSDARYATTSSSRYPTRAPGSHATSSSVSTAGGSSGAR